MRGNKSKVQRPVSKVDGRADRPSTIAYRLVTITALGVLLAPSLFAAQHTVEEVAAGLRAPDPATRLRAVQILKDAGYPEAAGPLSAALADPDDRVKLEAIDAERSLFMTRPIVRRKMIGFVVEVRTQDVGAQAFAAGEMALLPRAVPPEVLAGLAEAMHSANPRVRLDALYVFGVLAPLGGQAADDAIRSGISWTIEALRRGNRAEQVAAAAAAGRALKDCGLTAAGLKASPTGVGPGSRSNAGPGSASNVGPGFSPASEELCAEMGNALIEAVNNREPQVYRAAMASLGQLRYARATNALADQLSYYQRGPDGQAALEGLAGVGHPTSLDIFKRFLTNADADMRRFAVEGVARAGTTADLADLQGMGQTEKSNAVLLAVHYATLKLGAPAKPDALVAALRDARLRPLALQYLLDLSPSIAPMLAEALQGQDPETRMLVADVLGFSRDPTVIPRLEAAANDPDADAARAAQRAIDRIKLR